MRPSLVALILAASPVVAEPTFEHLSVFVWERPESYFGGWSGIEVAEGGDTFLAIGDNAQTFAGTFERQADQIAGILFAPIGALNDTDNIAFFRKQIEGISDSEGLAVFPDGRFAVSFERDPRILIYDGDKTPVRVALPREVNSLSKNAGIEALAVDDQDRLIAIPESAPPGATGFPVWRQAGAGWETLGQIRPSQGFQPVGADIGPDNRLYVLERAFRLVGFQNRIRAFDLEAIDPVGDVIWTPSLRAFDNLEGLSVWQDRSGSLRITMISDDNNRSFQQTQIVEFRLTR